MVEVKNGKKILTTPVSAEDLKDIKIGDIVYLNGSMTTCRDVAPVSYTHLDVYKRQEPMQEAPDSIRTKMNMQY